MIITSTVGLGTSCFPQAVNIVNDTATAKSKPFFVMRFLSMVSRI